VSLSRTSTGRPALACDGRNHPEGDHECHRRFYSPKRDARSYPHGVENGDLRVRALHRGWTCFTNKQGVKVDLCPYHGRWETATRQELCAALMGLGPLGGDGNEDLVAAEELVRRLRGEP